MSEKQAGMTEVEISIEELMDLVNKAFVLNPDITADRLINDAVNFIGLREINKRKMIQMSKDNGLTFKKEFWFQEI